MTPPWPDDPLPEIAELAAARPLVVIDDDPTGTQTLRDVSVLTGWDADGIARHLHDSAVFLSTNSRALDEDGATAAARSAATAAREAATAVGRPVSVVSRSDSTLRGHFPGETRAIEGALGMTGARVLLAPYLGEAGRITVADRHYLVRDGERLNVADSEFARDARFGYRSTDLPGWIAERHRAAGVPAPPVVSMPLAVVRGDGPKGVAEVLRAAPAGAVVVINAEQDRDIEVVALGALRAEEDGLPLVARTAASYVRARAGRPPASLLRPGELAAARPGLIVVGSHVELSTRQLARLLASPVASAIDPVELPVAPLVQGGRAAAAAVASVVRTVDLALGSGRIALIATERTRREVSAAGERAIAAALVDAVTRIEGRPGWVLAKGGITSHEIASRALGMREARVAGQLLAGVPVWVGTPGSRWPGVPLVVFPGNVGEDDALVRAVQKLEAS